MVKILHLVEAELAVDIICTVERGEAGRGVCVCVCVCVCLYFTARNCDESQSINSLLGQKPPGGKPWVSKI